jgi:hypothetical protein
VYHDLLTLYADEHERMLRELAARPRLERPDPSSSRGQRLRRRIRELARTRRGAPVSDGVPVTIRLAGEHDQLAVARLAALDDRLAPSSPVLVAAVENEIVAALPLDAGPVLRHPFVASGDVVELLELRRLQLRVGRRAA